MKKSCHYANDMITWNIKILGSKMTCFYFLYKIMT